MNHKLLKFAIVGGIGFLVDFTAMLLFTAFLPLLVARLLAFFIALNSNWLLNRYFTFKQQINKQNTKKRQEWLKFVVSSCLGAIPNIVCYLVIINAFQLSGLNAVVAIIPGILLGMIVNFLLADRWVFRASS